MSRWFRDHPVGPHIRAVAEILTFLGVFTLGIYSLCRWVQQGTVVQNLHNLK